MHYCVSDKKTKKSWCGMPCGDWMSIRIRYWYCLRKNNRRNSSFSMILEISMSQPREPQGIRWNYLKRMLCSNGDAWCICTIATPINNSPPCAVSHIELINRMQQCADIELSIWQSNASSALTMLPGTAILLWFWRGNREIRFFFFLIFFYSPVSV